MDNKEQCRAEFEYWHRGEFGYFESLLDYAGEYAAKDIEGRWKSWQASRATSPAPAVVQMTGWNRHARKFHEVRVRRATTIYRGFAK